MKVQNLNGRYLMILRKYIIGVRFALANIVLISNAFVWYYLAFYILKELIKELFLSGWAIHFFGAIFSAILGAILSEKIHKRTTFLAFWMIFGIISSLVLIIVKSTSMIDVLAISFLFGSSFGLGVPASLGYFTDSIAIENRGKLGGVIFCVNSIGGFLILLMVTNDIVLQALSLAIWRALGLIVFYIVKPSPEIDSRKSTSFKSILSQRPFILYYVPWIMFSLVNYLSLPVQFNILGSDTVNLLITVETLLAGVFAIFGGILSDTIGRKRMIVFGFIILGLGYAILGIYPENMLCWYFYTFADGLAWGIFYVIFIFTLWGDLSQNVSSEKYYALGGLPFFISNFLRIIIGSYIAQTVSFYAIFSFVAFFLFLAVVPLMFAPETLPEKKLRERELRQYVEKAKKIKEKYI
ncbi:MAG: MFS transporter [Candidatus Bathyarchaeales archaeon]